MPWYCLGCGRPMGSPLCKKKCRLKWGEPGAERIPPLDGFARFDTDPSVPEEDDLAARAVWFAVKRKKDENAGPAE